MGNKDYLVKCLSNLSCKVELDLVDCSNLDLTYVNTNNAELVFERLASTFK